MGCIVLYHYYYYLANYAMEVKHAILYAFIVILRMELQNINIAFRAGNLTKLNKSLKLAHCFRKPNDE